MNKMENFNKSISLDRKEIETINTYLSKLILLADSGELAISVSFMRDNLEKKLNEFINNENNENNKN
jgi:hypothetical protein